MNSTSSKITSKWQITIPEEVRKGISLKIGERIEWQVKNDQLVGKKVQSVSELAGCLKGLPTRSGDKPSSSAFAKASLERHNRISRQKP